MCVSMLLRMQLLLWLLMLIYRYLLYRTALLFFTVSPLFSSSTGKCAKTAEPIEMPFGELTHEYLLLLLIINIMIIVVNTMV